PLSGKLLDTVFQQWRLVGIEAEVGFVFTRVAAQQVGAVRGPEFDAVHGRVASPQRRFRVSGAELSHPVEIRQKAAAALGPQGVNYPIEFHAKVMGLEMSLV